MDWLGTARFDRGRLLAAFFLGAALLLVAGSTAQEAEQPPSEPALKQPPAVFLVQLPLPLVGVSDEQFEARVNALLADVPKEGPRPILVVEFVAKADDAARTSRFERALRIARYLTSERLARVRTVAWLPQSVTGHGVLPVLACEQIIMAPDAMLGAAGIEESAIDPTLRQGYSEIAERRRTVPAAVAVSMLEEPRADPGANGGGRSFCLARRARETSRIGCRHCGKDTLPRRGANPVQRAGYATGVGAREPPR
jgi:hypothetical protein